MEQEKWEISGKVLRLGNGVDIGFDYPISEVVLIDEVLIVMVKPPSGSHYNNNVFGISLDGKLIWQLNNPNSKEIDNPITGLYNNPDGIKLFAYQGFLYSINITSGVITGQKFVK